MGINRLKKERIIEEGLPVLRDESAVIAGYLFGSVATGAENAMSDIDVAVLSSRNDVKSNARLTQKLAVLLSEALDSLAVDVVVLNGADLALRYDVILTGLLFYDKEPVRRIRFEKKTLVEYFDMVPLWDVYDRQMAIRLGGRSSS